MISLKSYNKLKNQFHLLKSKRWGNLIGHKRRSLSPSIRWAMLNWGRNLFYNLWKRSQVLMCFSNRKIRIYWQLRIGIEPSRISLKQQIRLWRAIRTKRKTIGSAMNSLMRLEKIPNYSILSLSSDSIW